jgi:hypothetical protein
MTMMVISRSPRLVLPKSFRSSMSFTMTTTKYGPIEMKLTTMTRDLTDRWLARLLCPKLKRTRSKLSML